MGKPEDPQFKPHAGIKMAQVLGSLVYIYGEEAVLKYPGETGTRLGWEGNRLVLAEDW